jgi:hypothetical protein
LRKLEGDHKRPKDRIDTSGVVVKCMANVEHAARVSLTRLTGEELSDTHELVLRKLSDGNPGDTFCSLRDIAAAVNMPEEETAKILDDLLAAGGVRTIPFPSEDGRGKELLYAPNVSDEAEGG